LVRAKKLQTTPAPGPSYRQNSIRVGGVAFHGQAPVERAVPVLRAQGAAGHRPAPQTVGEAADPQRLSVHRYQNSYRES
jgi:hypothetical protein